MNAIKQMQRSGAKIIGVVLNQIPRKSEEYTGLYRYYAGYYAERDDEEEIPQNGKARLPRYLY